MAPGPKVTSIKHSKVIATSILEHSGYSLLQDAANATLRSETLRETLCDTMIANSAVGKPSEMYKTFAMMDASNTFRF